MKICFLVTGLLAVFLFSPSAIAQKSESAVVAPIEKPVISQKDTTLLTEAKSQPLPKEEEKPLVSTQESKARLVPPPARLEPVVVAATRVEQPLSQIALPVTVISRERIEQESDLQLIDTLRTVPGVNVVRSGTRGRTASIFIRGANSNHTLFMVDGVQVSSPTTGDFNPTNLSLEGVERIEIIRGPQSTLYGSDAIGGVINIITRRGSGKGIRPSITGQFEYGSEYTFSESGTLSGNLGPFNYFGSVSRLDTDAGVAKRLLEKSTYQDTNVAGRMSVALPHGSELDFIYHFTHAFSPFDDGTFRNDVNALSKSNDNVFSTVLKLNPFSWLTETIKGSFYHSTLFSVDHADPNTAQRDPRPFELDAQIYTFDFQNDIRPFETNTLTAGYELEVQRADNKSFDRILRNNGFYIQDQQVFWDRLFLTAGIRFEDQSAFGNSTNPKFSAAYLLKETGTKFKGSFGTAFRAPTLNQLFFPNFGNPDLQPEESRSYDMGFEQELPFWRSHFDLSLFHTHFENLIQFIVVAGRFQPLNTGKATSDGVEMALDFEPIDGILQTRGYYTYMMTKDKSIAGGELTRRPMHAGGVNLNLHLFDRWNLNLDAQFAGDRNDRTGIRGRPTVEINKGYPKLDLTLSYDLFGDWQIYGRAENIMDTDYDEVLGFQNSGALFFGGVKFKGSSLET